MPEESSKPGTARGTQLPVKWIVVGVVVIAFMLIFKAELGGLLERTSDVKITASGVEIKAQVKTVETPIGQTEVSVVTTSPATPPVTGIRETTYSNSRYGFQISWPDNRNWTPDEAFGPRFIAEMGMPDTVALPIAIFANSVVDDFRPGVNVVVEKVGQMSIEQYLAISEQNLRQQGWTVLSSSVDPETRGGVIVFINHMLGRDIYQFQRYAMGNNGLAYVITASQVPEAGLTQGLKDDLASIINSFRLID